MDGHLDKLLKSTMDYHQFQIEFNSLNEKLYQQLKNIPTVVSPNRLDNIFHFYARTRTVFFDVIKVASEHMMVDLNVKKLGLRDLLDSEFAGKGLDWLKLFYYEDCGFGEIDLSQVFFYFFSCQFYYL